MPDPASPPAPPVKKSVALSGVVAGNTAICTVGQAGNDLHYRGYDITELAAQATYEEVAHLLIHERLPNHVELGVFRARLVNHRGLPRALRAVLEQIPAGAHPMDVLRTGCSMLGHLEPEALPPAADRARLVEKMLSIDADVFGTKDLVPQRADVMFGDSVQDTPLALAQTALALEQAKAASTDVKVRMLHPDWDEPQIDEEVEIAARRPHVDTEAAREVRDVQEAALQVREHRPQAAQRLRGLGQQVFVPDLGAAAGDRDLLASGADLVRPVSGQHGDVLRRGEPGRPQRQGDEIGGHSETDGN